MNSTERHEARYQRRKVAREMKRREKLDVYDNFTRVSSPAAIRKANFDARKGVMFKANVIRYQTRYYHNSFLQSRDLNAGKDIRRGFYVFTIIERGKKRNIHSLHYAERVIRRSACINALVPILSSNLIYDNGASLKGKGVGFHVDRCETHLHQYYRKYGNEGYVIVIDFKGFFDHLLHGELFKIIDKMIHDLKLNKLAKDFISASDMDKPDNQQGIGLYIGPEDSQIFAVAYPNAVDHLIKDQWQIKQYARYMDDSYIIVPTKEQAQEILKKLLIEYDKYGIVPNPKKTQIVKLSKGFSFLKTRYYLTKTGKVIRKADHKAITRERRKLKKQYSLSIKGILTFDAVTQSYMSWRGAALKHDAYFSVHSMDQLFYSLFKLKPWKKQKNRRKAYYGKQKNS